MARKRKFKKSKGNNHNNNRKKHKQPVHYPQFFTLTLCKKINEYDSIYSFHFTGEHTIYYKPGMYVHLIKPNTRDGTLTADSVRHMSFASSPSHDKNIISFAMDVGSGSMFKIAMANLQIGDQVDIFKIKYKNFEPCWKKNDKILFLAGGIGITPIRSLIHQYNKEIHFKLIHVARDDKHLYSNEFEILYNKGDENNENDKKIHWTNHEQIENVLDTTITQTTYRWIYICGSDRFTKGMVQLLTDKLNVSKDILRVESFH